MRLRFWIRKIVRLTAILISALLVLALLLVLLVSTSPVQSRLVSWARGYLAAQLDTRVEVDEIRAALPTEAVLKCVTIYDRQDWPMLEAEEVRIDVLNFSIWRFLLEKDKKQSLKLEGLSLIKPRIFIYKSALDGQTNLKTLFQRKKPKKDKKPLKLDIEAESITIENGKFYFLDSTDTRVNLITPGSLNYKNLAVENLNGELGFRYASSGRLELDVHYLDAWERNSDFSLNRLKVDFVSDTLHRWVSARDCYEIEPYVSCQALELDAGNTRLRGDLRFKNETLTMVVDTFTDNDTFSLLLNPGSALDFSTINYFIPKELPLLGVVRVAGLLEGNFTAVKARNLRASYLDSTWVAGDVHLTDIQNGDSLWLDIALQKSSLSFRELDRLLPGVDFPLALQKLGRLGIEGTYIGHYYDFNTDARITTRQGSAEGKIHMILPPYRRSLTYDGSLRTKNLNLNALGVGNGQLSDRLNFNGTVQGEGLTIADLNTRFDAYLTDSRVVGYTLDSVYANLLLKDRQVAGILRVDDPEGKVDLFVDLNLARSPKVYTINGSIDQVNLEHYGVLKEPVSFSTALDLDFTGDSLENADGTLTLLDARLERKLKDSVDVFKIPGLSLSSTQLEAGRMRFDLKSVLADGYMEGAFSIKKVVELTQRLTREGQLFFQNNDSLTLAYYKAKKQDSSAIDNLDLNFNLVTEDSINAIFGYLRLPAYLSPGASADGFIEFGTEENALVTLTADSAAFRKTEVRHTKANLNLIKDATSDFVILDSDVKSGTIRLSPAFAVDTLIYRGSIESDTLYDKLKASIYTHQNGGLNQINLEGNAKFLRTGAIETRLDSASSWLVLDDLLWRLNKDHLITFLGTRIGVENLLLNTEGQSVQADGFIGESIDDELSVRGADINLGLLNEFFKLPYQFSGDFNATIVLNALLADLPRIGSRGTILDFALDGYRYGDIMVNSVWDRPNNKLDVEGDLIHEDDSKIKLKGAYRLGDEASPLDFKLITEGAFPLAYVYPFVKTQFYNVEGKVDLRDFTITGSFREMVVLGDGRIKDAHIGVDFFQTEYDFDGDVRFDRNAIRFSNFLFTDQFSHTAQLKGEVRHRGFRDIFFDLKVEEANNFLIMDTDKKDNPDYNGTIFIDRGQASVTGPMNQIKINAKGISGAGSILRVPLSGSTNLKRPDFIRFTGEEDEERKKVKTGFEGFELNLTVTATPESEVELIFDEKVGDIMRGRGAGAITLRVNEQGEFEMFGELRVEQGEYLFTAQNIVNKRFEVKPGGTITWSGDPYEARLNLDAVYPVYADIQDFLPDVNRPFRTRVNVVMHLQGILLQPEITLDIEIGNLNELAAINLAKYLRSIRYDQQELNKQVFSLMVFKRFAVAGQEANVNVLGGEGVTSSISELLSNQFNYWLGQALGDNLNIGVGTDNFRELDFRVSAVLFNDRVTIERDGALVTEDQNFSLGNISVNIRLSRDAPAGTTSGERPGELVLEVFTRENFDFSANQTQRTNQTGLGIFYKKDLDRLGDLFRKRKQTSELND